MNSYIADTGVELLDGSPSRETALFVAEAICEVSGRHRAAVARYAVRLGRDGTDAEGARQILDRAISSADAVGEQMTGDRYAADFACNARGAKVDDLITRCLSSEDAMVRSLGERAAAAQSSRGMRSHSSELQ